MPVAAFVDLGKDIYDQHGVYSLIAVLKKNGVQVHYVGRASAGRTIRKLQALGADALLYSSFSHTLDHYAAFDRIAKQALPRVVSVIGGPGPTLSPHELKDSTIDAYCVGEGEQSLVGFLRGGFTSYGNIRRRDEGFSQRALLPLADLDALPLPDRDVVYGADSLLRDAPSKQFFSGRGCPYDCTYCVNHSFRELFKGLGPVMRKKSVGYVLEEIRSVRAKYPLGNVVFNDDLFIMDKKWLWEFAERYPREIGLPYTCNIRANLVDEDVVRALKDSGCRGTNWSIECGDAQLRNEVLRRNMTDEHILRTGELLAKYRIPNRIGNLIAIPGENRGQMLKTVEMNIRCRPTLAIGSIFTPYPGLRLTQYAIDKGYYTPRPAGDLPHNCYRRSVLNISRADNRWVQKLMCLFPVFVRFPGLYARRGVRRFLWALPIFLLRPVRELVFTMGMIRLYIAKTPLRLRLRMAMRYIRNLW